MREVVDMEDLRRKLNNPTHTITLSSNLKHEFCSGILIKYPLPGGPFLSYFFFLFLYLSFFFGLVKYYVVMGIGRPSLPGRGTSV